MIRVRFPASNGKRVSSPCAFFKLSTTPWRRTGGGGIFPHILDLALNAGEYSASGLGRFTPTERGPGTHWTGCLVGSRIIGGTRGWRKKFPVPIGTRTPDHPARILALYNWAIPAGAGDFSLWHCVQTGSAARAWSWPLTSNYSRCQRMRGTVSPLPQYVLMVWCLVKFRDNFTF
jgi:hypothetical protein